MNPYQKDILIYLKSLKSRINGLGSLKKLVGEKGIQHLTQNQWHVLDQQFLIARRKFLSVVSQILQVAKTKDYSQEERRKMYHRLGNIEMELAKTYGFFDTYLDILSQRTTTELGSILSGIDVIAESAIRVDIPRLKKIVRPLVYCDRGFGASILREGVPFPDGSQNPMPLIQIPYSRITVKYLLTSVIHEAGHQTLTRLGMKNKMAQEFYNAIKKRSGSERLARLYANWSTEICPDYWSWCLTGYAQTAGLKEVLTLPPSRVLKLGNLDPHPPPYLRTLLSLSWTESAFGKKAIFERWRKEWLNTYLIQSVEESKKELFEEAIRFFPIINDLLFNKKWKGLGNKSFTEIFPLDQVSLSNLKRIGNLIKNSKINNKKLNPTQVIAAHRYLIDHDEVNHDHINQIITSWIKSLNRKSNKTYKSWQQQKEQVALKNHRQKELFLPVVRPHKATMAVDRAVNLIN
ncbi:MAG: hypothetical protein HKN53_05875 [Maribacter sp.]|nr:hypothetical protein [Maribacter sp.]